jgi:hypothetical protein
LAAVVLVLGSAGVASADGQLQLRQSLPIAWDEFQADVCPPEFTPGQDQVVWDFVLTQALGVTDAVLTTTFADAGSGQRAFDVRASSVLHWYVTTGQDTLLDAYVNYAGQVGGSAFLALARVCVGQSGGGGGGAGAGETPVGSDVSVVPDGAPDPSSIQVTFQTVSVAGTTTVALSDTGPELPAGYQAGVPPTYYDVQTTATYAGTITVCFSYAGQSPAPTALFHYENGDWVDVTSSNDPDNQKICGVTTSLSPFVAAHLTPPTLTTPGPISVVASGPSGAVVTYGVTASDYAGTSIEPSCAPSSGTTFPIGLTTVSCTAVDSRGVSASATFDVIVGYAFLGFGQPLNDPITATNPMSVFRGGSTVVVRFSLAYSGGTLIADAAAAALAAQCAATISVTQDAGGAPSIDEAACSASPTAGTCFRYDSATHQFLFNLGTRGLAAPATYVIAATVAAADSTVLAEHSLAIGLR